MHNGNLVIFNEEPEYAGHLKAALLSESSPSLKVFVFKNIDSFYIFSEENKVDILLTGETTQKEIRKEMPADKKFVLTSNKTVELNKDEEEVYKYQNVESIVYTITKGTGMCRHSDNAKDRKLIGVYSPVHRIGNTKFALELGQKMSKDEMVLYLNLEGYSGGSCYFKDNSGGDISDLIYYIHQENCDIGNILGKITFSIGTLDCVGPAEVVDDIRDVNKSEWMVLFEKIFENTVYTSIILDLSDMVNDLNSILEECNTVYTRYLKDDISKAKIEQYTDNLRSTGYTKIIEHTVLKEVEYEEGVF